MKFNALSIRGLKKAVNPLLIIGLAFILIAGSLGCGRIPNRLKGRVAPDDPHLRYFGPVDLSNPKLPRLSWSGSGVEAAFQGTRLTLLLANQSEGLDLNGDPVTNYFDVIIDRKDTLVLKADNNRTVYPLFDDLPAGKHHLRIVKRTEALIGPSVFMGLRLGRLRKLHDLPDPPGLQLEFVGSSATCGYGVEGQSEDCRFSSELENINRTYPAVAANILQADWVTFCYSGRGVSQNYDGTRVNTMPELYGRARYDAPDKDWNPESWQPAAVMINLGAGDYYAGPPDQAAFISGYDSFLLDLRNRYPQAKLVLIGGPNPVDEGPTAGKLAELRDWLDLVQEKAFQRGDSLVMRFDFPATPAGDYGCDQQPNVRHQARMGEELAGFLMAEVITRDL